MVLLGESHKHQISYHKYREAYWEFMEAIDPEHSRPLDVHRWSDHPEIKVLTDGIWIEITEIDGLVAIPTGNRKPLAPLIKQLRVLLVDLYVAWLADSTLSIGISRNNNSYTPKSRYNGLHISKDLIKVVDALVAIGLLDHHNFHHDRVYGGKNSKTSRYRPSNKLQDRFSKLQDLVFDISFNEERETIVLSDFEIDEEGTFIKTKDGKKKRSLIEYEDDDHPLIVPWRLSLCRYNELLARSHIDISSLDKPYVEREIKDGKVQRVPVGRSNQWVKRVFSRNSWEMNGRFYGGWWQQVSSSYRKDIRIDGSPTVEIDYKGMHVAMLAAECGVVMNEDYDWYTLDEVVVTGLDKATQRKALKLLVLTAINAASKETAYKAYQSKRTASKDDITSLHEFPRLNKGQLDLLLTCFIEKHPFLADGICSDRGIGLMFMDSQITDIIINSFVEQNEPILTVHDSYIVKTDKADFLQQTMAEATQLVVNSKLPAEHEGQFTRQQSQQILNQFRQHDFRTYLDLLGNKLNRSPHKPVQTNRYQNDYNKFKKWRENKEANEQQ